ERYGFCCEFDHVQQQVERCQPDAKGCGKQLMNKTASTLDLEVVIDHQCEHSERNTHRAVQVGGRHHAMMRNQTIEADSMKKCREHVDWQKIEAVHQRNPDKYR